MAATGKRPGPRVLGLTGPIGCGKTTVGDILLELGALERIDADRVVHSLMQPGTPVTARIREVFGDDIVLPDGSIDRRRLGEIVFLNGEALGRLEAIVHPAVRQSVRERLGELGAGQGVVVIDAVKLLQSELLELADSVWAVHCSHQAQLARLTEIRGMSGEAAQARIDSMPSFFHPRVTTVIENSGSLEDLRRAVQTAWSEFLQSSDGPRPDAGDTAAIDRSTASTPQGELR